MTVSVCVCLSAREHISGTTRPIFTKLCVHVVYGRSSVLLRGAGRYDTLCTAGFSVISLVFLTMLFVLIITFWLCVYVGLCEWNFFYRGSV